MFLQLFLHLGVHANRLPLLPGTSKDLPESTAQVVKSMDRKWATYQQMAPFLSSPPLSRFDRFSPPPLWREPAYVVVRPALQYLFLALAAFTSRHSHSLLYARLTELELGPAHVPADASR